MSGDEIMSAAEIDNAWQSSPDDIDWPQILRSHEALRAERDAAESVAERLLSGWVCLPHVDLADLDPRGGPTVRVVAVDPPHAQPGRATVTDRDGKRRRRILLARFRPHGGYRSGYTLVSRPAEPNPERTP